MKKLNLVQLILIINFSAIGVSYSQPQFFDSVNILASSQIYDYKNPVFENGNYLLSSTGYIAYEKHTSSLSSDIVVRKYDYAGYHNEISLTGNSGYLNVNPHMTGKIIVWQSNKKGNWDLYYSIYDNEWSAPILLDSASDDATDPYIYYNNSFPIQYNFYYLAYKRNNNISFKKFRTSSGIWDFDTTITSGNEEFGKPVISDACSSNRYCIVYLRQYGNNFFRINVSRFYHSASIGIFLEPAYEIYQPNSQSELKVSYTYSTMISYSYDTLGRKNIIGFRIDTPFNMQIFTMNVPGMHISGRGQNMNIVTDGFGHFSTFASNAISKDSFYLTIAKNIGIIWPDTVSKKFYLSDTTVKAKFDISQPVYFSFYYRMNAVWEKIINGRTILVESKMTDVVSSVDANEMKVSGFHLKQNYPNPFNPETVISYSIPSDVRGQTSNVKLVVYDNLGKEIVTLVNEKQSPGNYAVDFNGKVLPSGVYFYKLEAGDFSETKRMILLK